MKVHHTTPIEGKTCTICNKPIMNMWYDATENNGKSERYQERKGGVVVHYFCIPNAKTLQQLNDERQNMPENRG